KLVSLGATVKLEDIGTQKLSDDTEISLPPLLIGELGNDVHKKTVLIYGHLDVQPASKSDGWDTEPFELVCKDDKLYGRGSTDDKGPVLAWFHAIEAFQKLEMDIPINLKFCLEGMEESGSEGLEQYLIHNPSLFNNVDFICISDNYWIGTKTPCVTVGLRGMCYFFVNIECSDRDLHSGSFGGTVYEAMTDLMKVMSTLVTNQGHINIEGVYDDVHVLSEKEKSFFAKIDEFNLEDYKKEAGIYKVIQDNPAEVLMARSVIPSLSLHGIEGAFSGVGSKTDPVKIEQQVVRHINKEFSKLSSPNKLTVSMQHGARAWSTDIEGPHAKAAVDAIKSVFNVEPFFTMEGGSIPITLTFEDVSKKSVLLLPIGASDDGEHSQNEKINVYNYINGIKLFCSYMNEMSKIA
ncbi:hypothetical protein GJ496_009993, partial [Pomphorhynchus laevis]